MMIRLGLLALLFGCPNSKMVNEDGEFSRLFPKTPLSEAPCLEDQDCVVTHLQDGHCCPGPIHNASHLYTRDQFDRLVSHQAQICTESEADYTCPPAAAPPTHIDTVNKGRCIEQRCVLVKVPAEAPGAPPPRIEPAVPPTPSQPTAGTQEAIPTVASP